MRPRRGHSRARTGCRGRARGDSTRARVPLWARTRRRGLRAMSAEAAASADVERGGQSRRPPPQRSTRRPAGADGARRMGRHSPSSPSRRAASRAPPEARCSTAAEACSLTGLRPRRAAAASTEWRVDSAAPPRLARGRCMLRSSGLARPRVSNRRPQLVRKICKHLLPLVIGNLTSHSHSRHDILNKDYTVIYSLIV